MKVGDHCSKCDHEFQWGEVFTQHIFEEHHAEFLELMVDNMPNFFKIVRKEFLRE